MLLKLWLIGNRTEWSPIRSVIILVIKQIGLPILLITRLITDQIGLHSVLLPLLIMFFNKRLNYNVWLTYQHLDPTVVYCFPRVDLRRSTMPVFRGKYPVVEKLNGSRRLCSTFPQNGHHERSSFRFAAIGRHIGFLDFLFTPGFSQSQFCRRGRRGEAGRTYQDALWAWARATFVRYSGFGENKLI